MLNKRFIQALGLMAITTLSASTASAGVITEFTGFSLSNSTSADNGNGSTVNFSSSRTRTGEFSIAKFDSSLGTLNSVFITFTSDWAQTSEIDARDSTPEIVDTEEYNCGGGNTCTRNIYRNNTYVGATATSAFIAEFVDPIGFSSNTSGSSGTSCSDTTTNSTAFCRRFFNDNSNFFNGLLASESGSLSSFIGVDPLNVRLSNTIGISGTCDSSDSALDPSQRAGVDICSASTNNTWNGSVRVRYIFTEAPVPAPEPALISMLAAGLLGFAINRRRSIKQPTKI